MDGCTDVWTDGRTDVRNFSPFYRTSSPLGAAAQKERKNGRMEERQGGTLDQFHFSAASSIVNSHAGSHRSFAHCDEFLNEPKRRWRRRRKRLSHIGNIALVC